MVTILYLLFVIELETKIIFLFWIAHYLIKVHLICICFLVTFFKNPLAFTGFLLIFLCVILTSIMTRFDLLICLILLDRASEAFVASQSSPSVHTIFFSPQ